MRPRPRPLLVLGFVVAMAALWIARAPPNPTLARALKDGEARLRQFYRERPLPTGWRLAGVSAVSRRQEVWVDVRLAADAAAALAAQPPATTAAAIAGLCPPATDPVWRIIHRRQEIEIRAAGEGGGAVVAVNCRAQGPR